VTDPAVAVPEGYPQLLEQLKTQVHQARIRASRVVNTELLTLYWDLGSAILDRQEAEGRGTKVIDRLVVNLRAAFPEMRGFSRSNLKYMRQMASSWPRTAISQQAVGQLPWGHLTVLLDKLATQPDRDWYATSAAEHGWSRNVLLHRSASAWVLAHQVSAAPERYRGRRTFRATPRSVTLMIRSTKPAVSVAVGDCSSRTYPRTSPARRTRRALVDRARSRRQRVLRRWRARPTPTRAMRFYRSRDSHPAGAPWRLPAPVLENVANRVPAGTGDGQRSGGEHVRRASVHRDEPGTAAGRKLDLNDAPSLLRAPR